MSDDPAVTEQAVLAEAAAAAPEAWDEHSAATSAAVVHLRRRSQARSHTHVLTVAPPVFVRAQIAPGVSAPSIGATGYDVKVWLRRGDGSSVTGARPVWTRRGTTRDGAVAIPDVFARPPTAKGRAASTLRYEIELTLYRTEAPGSGDEVFASVTLMPAWGLGGERTLLGQQRRLAHLGYVTGNLARSFQASSAADPFALVSGRDNPSTQQAILNFQADTEGLRLNGDIAHLASPGVAAVTRNADSADKLGEVADHDEGERA